MGRPRRGTVDAICDYFADLSPEAQDGLLITLAAIHRQAKRRARGATGPEPESRAGFPLNEGVDAEGLTGERNAALDLGEGTKQ